MGHLINPITFRLGKTKFWSSIWSSKTRKNYKNYLFEDFNLYNFLNWILSVLSWNKVGIFISDFKFIKSFHSINVSFFFFMNRLRLISVFKKSFFKFKPTSSFLNFFFKLLLNKKFFRFQKFLFKKDFFLNKKTKNKKLLLKRKRVFKFLIKQIPGLKRKKNTKKRLWLNTFLFKYCLFLSKNSKKYKKNYLNIFNSYFLNKNMNKNIFLSSFYNQNKIFNIIQKNSSARSLNYKFFFNILSFFLSFFLKKVFKHKNFYFNFFNKTDMFYNAKSIKEFINFSMQKNRSKVTQVVKKVFRKTRKKYYILGLKIGFFGRYEKKLRNKSVWQSRGSLSPSNINTPLMHKNFCILLKQGLCGVKVSFLSKLKKNEIFKKKTFVNKAFKVR